MRACVCFVMYELSPTCMCRTYSIKILRIERIFSFSSAPSVYVRVCVRVSVCGYRLLLLFRWKCVPSYKCGHHERALVTKFLSAFRRYGTLAIHSRCLYLLLLLLIDSNASLTTVAVLWHAIHCDFVLPDINCGNCSRQSQMASFIWIEL